MQKYFSIEEGGNTSLEAVGECTTPDPLSRSAEGFISSLPDDVQHEINRVHIQAHLLQDPDKSQDVQSVESSPVNFSKRVIYLAKKFIQDPEDQEFDSSLDNYSVDIRTSLQYELSILMNFIRDAIKGFAKDFIDFPCKELLEKKLLVYPPSLHELILLKLFHSVLSPIHGVTMFHYDPKLDLKEFKGVHPQFIIDMEQLYKKMQKV